jgi:nicotinamide-nucleotide amidase
LAGFSSGASLKSTGSASRDSSGVDSIEGLVHQVIQTLLKSKQTVSFAESCTGGLLSARMAETPGVSAVYMGSVVTYSNEAKVEIIGVGLSSLQEQGAVSQIVAQEMAQGVRHRFHTDWGVLITGIAGPTGGSSEKPVGTVWIAVCGPRLADSFSADDKSLGPGTHDSSNFGASQGALKVSETFLEARKYFFKGDRKQIQEQSVQAALELLLGTFSRI